MAKKTIKINGKIYKLAKRFSLPDIQNSSRRLKEWRKLKIKATKYGKSLKKKGFNSRVKQDNYKIKSGRIRFGYNVYKRKK